MIRLKRGSTTNWRKPRVPLADGQPGYDKNKHKIKIGDGITPWSLLPYASGLNSDDILMSEEAAKLRNALDLEDTTLITYGTDFPSKDNIGQVYLQYYDTAPETDYIVEFGIDGNWQYQKWNSGIARCSGIFKITTPIQSPLGGSSLYQNNNEMSPVSYPFKFKSIPAENATLQSAGGLVWLSSAKNINTVDNSASYGIISADSLNNATYSLSLKVEGFWK